MNSFFYIFGPMRRIGAAILLSAVLAVSGAATAADIKVGFVYVGPIGDHGWTYQHNQARLALEKALGDRVETSFVESVPEGADSERVIHQLAASGHQLIFYHFIRLYGAHA